MTLGRRRGLFLLSLLPRPNLAALRPTSSAFVASSSSSPSTSASPDVLRSLVRTRFRPRSFHSSSSSLAMGKGGKTAAKTARGDARNAKHAKNDDDANGPRDVGSDYGIPPCPLAIHWFRNDLRLHDNPALRRTASLAKPGPGSGMLPVFVFDTSRIYGSSIRTPLGSLKCGPRRAQFALEAVADLRASLERKGSGLIVGVGKTEEVLGSIAASACKEADEGASVLKLSVVCQEEVCSEELAVDKAVRSSLAKAMTKGCNFAFETVWGSTLYDPESLPFAGDVSGVPDTFTPFRNKVEKSCEIGRPLDAPSDDELRMPWDAKDVVAGSKCRASLDYLPTLADLGYDEEDVASASTVDDRSAMPEGYRGGESFALARVNDYIWDRDLLKGYFDTRNGMIGSEYSTKFAPWLALGNVSPRYVARECRRYEEARVKNKSTYWVVFELLWRDYFKFFAKKHGDAVFRADGTIGNGEHVNKRKWGYDPKQVRAWKEGKTGFPLVDANMRELLATGFMSNRGRQNVASFLAIDMNADWRYGADHFEQHLLDYDVHSNWGNWCSAAGMTGGRLNRFNVVKQGRDYDFDGEYVRLWCPELKNVPDKYVHEPWKMSEALMEECGVKVGPGRDYPSPIVDPNVQPKIMRNDGRGGGRGGRGGGKGGRGGGKGGRGNQRRGADDGGRGDRNPNRGRGQRRDMKSLKTGSYQFESKYV
ncbi:hypothetical protein ACHAWF_018418 [Thalassiosira exigua]